MSSSSTKKRLAGARQRESVPRMKTPFLRALSLSAGGGQVEIVREGFAQVGELSTEEMMAIIASVGDARSKAVAKSGGRRAALGSMTPFVRPKDVMDALG